MRLQRCYNTTKPHCSINHRPASTGRPDAAQSGRNRNRDTFWSRPCQCWCCFADVGPNLADLAGCLKPSRKGFNIDGGPTPLRPVNGHAPPCLREAACSPVWILRIVPSGLRASGLRLSLTFTPILFLFLRGVFRNWRFADSGQLPKGRALHFRPDCWSPTDPGPKFQIRHAAEVKGIAPFGVDCRISRQSRPLAPSAGRIDRRRVPSVESNKLGRSPFGLRRHFPRGSIEQ